MTVTGVIVPLSRAAGAGARLESGTKACAGDAAVAACAAGLRAGRPRRGACEGR